MPVLSSAPLIEAIFELRWGNVIRSSSGGVELQYSEEERDFFQGKFHGLMEEKGFVVVEPKNSEIPDVIPHVIKHLFRTEPNLWPCYQTGLGIFTANQVNDGYEWNGFNKSILEGLEVLDKSHPLGLGGLPGIGVELRYQDGFFLEDGETPEKFLKNKMEISFNLPEDFLSLPDINNELKGNSVECTLDIHDPAGVIIIKLQQSIINGRPGFVMNTIVRSSDNMKPDFSLTALSAWLDKAHDVQKHAFRTLINKNYAGTFK